MITFGFSFLSVELRSGNGWKTWNGNKKRNNQHIWGKNGHKEQKKPIFGEESVRKGKSTPNWGQKWTLRVWHQRISGHKMLRNGNIWGKNGLKRLNAPIFESRWHRNVHIWGKNWGQRGKYLHVLGENVHKGGKFVVFGVRMVVFWLKTCPMGLKKYGIWRHKR